MQSIVANATKIIFVFAMLFFNISCKRKPNLKNQIIVKVISIDSETKRVRDNKFDTIVVRIRGNGFLTQSFEKVREYVTDSTGSVKIKLSGTEEYRFIIDGSGIHGSTSFTEVFSKHKLRDGQDVNIEVKSIKN